MGTRRLKVKTDKLTFNIDNFNLSVLTFNLLLLFAGLIFVRPVGGHAQIRHRQTAGRVAQLRILREIADQQHFVEIRHKNLF